MIDKKICEKISYGLYIVSSKYKDKFNGQIVDAVFQATSEPPTIALSINKKNLTHEFIEKSKFFSLSILAKDTPLKFIGNFGFKSGRDIDKFQNVRYKIGSSGTPIVIENTLAFLEAIVIDSISLSTHTIFVGKMLDAVVLKDEEPMTYDYYRKVKRGVLSENAPSYFKNKTS